MELKYITFHYMTCFKCVIISRAEYSFLRKKALMSGRKRAGFLSLNRISELVWDGDSYEAEAPCDSSCEDKGGFEDEPGVSHLQPDRRTSRGHASSNSFSSYATDEEEILQSGPGPFILSFTGGGFEEISYRDSRFIFVNDIVETIAQVGRHE
jgi:hypothetical protein